MVTDIPYRKRNLAIIGGGITALGLIGFVYILMSGAGHQASDTRPDLYGEKPGELINRPTPSQMSENANVEVSAEQASPKPNTNTPQISEPAFDVVRIAPDGAGVLAGSAEPESEVIFKLDGEEFARAKADAQGKFAAVLEFPPSRAPQALTMVSLLENGDKIASSGTLLISPIKLSDVSDPEGETPDIDPNAETGSAFEGVIARMDTPSIVLADEKGAKMLQPAKTSEAPVSDKAPQVSETVVIDTITYGSEGEVALAGRGASDRFVRVYLDDRPIKTIAITEDGSWDTPLPDIDAGVYRLRVDEIGEEGEVTSRVETPFQREEVEFLAEVATSVTVQPGYSLWTIAQERFGDGIQYIRVYEANKDLIRDPNLIYPGQVFNLPEE